MDKRRKNGDKRDSLLDRILDEEVKFDVPMTDIQLNNFVGGIHEGASDTTATATLTTILYLAKHPEFQNKARAELDHVCGTNRTPNWSDFPNLPYINCIVKEGLRVQPVYARSSTIFQIYANNPFSASQLGFPTVQNKTTGTTAC